MTHALELYNKWLAYDKLDAELKAQLEEIKDHEEEINERFYCELSFGTAGLRGIIGAGTNRMNIYVVKRATQGLADVISKEGQEAKNRGVAIAYDSRLYSDRFAKEAALVLAANGIKAYLFDELRPTPELSFTIRHLNCISGIIVTTSHNPAKYNGYKVYWEDGAQLPPEFADEVLKNINETDIFDGVKSMPEKEALEKGLLTIIGKEVDEALKAVDMYEFRKATPHRLSGGQKQRIAIAGIIAMKPDCIVLDEPTAMLDPKGRAEIVSTIKKLNRENNITIVLITHFMEEAVDADRVIVMDSGVIVADDTPKQIFSNIKLLKDVGLDVPQTTELLYRLKTGGMDISTDVISIEESAQLIYDAIHLEVI